MNFVICYQYSIVLVGLIFVEVGGAVYAYFYPQDDTKVFTKEEMRREHVKLRSIAFFDNHIFEVSLVKI